MEHAVAAPPGTFVVERTRGEKPTTIRTPVVMFLYLQGNRAFPVCGIAFNGLTIGRALLTADGYVTDPAVGAVFDNLSDWEHLADTDGYWSATSKVGFVPPVQDAGDDDDEGQDAATDAAITRERDANRQHRQHEERAGRIPDKPVGPAKPPRQFKDKSFWKSESNKWIWQVPGGTTLVELYDYTKVKRDDYDALKKAGWTVMAFEDIQNGVVPGDDEPERAESFHAAAEQADKYEAAREVHNEPQDASDEEDDISNLV